MKRNKDSNLKILVLSRNFPNNIVDSLGLWVKRLVCKVAETEDVKVISPTPYCPPIPRFYEYTRFRRVVHHSQENGFEIFYPRFIVGFGRILYPTEAISYLIGIHKKVARIRRKFAFDLIHAHFIYPDGVVAAFLAQHYNVPLVITEHAPWSPNWIDKSILIRFQALWAAKKSTFLIPVSRSVQKTMESFKIETRKIRVIPNGVDQKTFIPLKKGEKKNRNQILYVGLINFNKGIDVLFKAFKQIIIKNSHLKLIMIGGSFYHNTRMQQEKLMHMAVDLGLNNHVQFLGIKHPSEVARYMRESALVILPSRAESFGSVLVEALSCGTPVISTLCGGPEDIVKTDVGVLVPVGNNFALANAIETVLEREEMYLSNKLRNYAIERFSWDTIAAQNIDLYYEAIQQYKTQNSL